MYKILSNSVEETIDISNRLARLLTVGDILVLNGNLGSGKTYFTKGIVKHFSNENIVSSPTFTIVNEYPTSIPIFHFDVYRLENSDEFLQIGGEEYFEQGISIIEWGEKIQDILPNNYLEIVISKQDNDTREILFLPHGNKYEKYMEEYFNENFRN